MDLWKWGLRSHRGVWDPTVGFVNLCELMRILCEFMRILREFMRILYELMRMLCEFMRILYEFMRMLSEFIRICVNSCVFYVNSCVFYVNSCVFYVLCTPRWARQRSGGAVGKAGVPKWVSFWGYFCSFFQTRCWCENWCPSCTKPYFLRVRGCPIRYLFEFFFLACFRTVFLKLQVLWGGGSNPDWWFLVPIGEDNRRGR